MNLINLLKEFLTSECGFQDWQVTNRFGGEVIVYLNGRKLHFTFQDNIVDCCLMFGGMSTPSNHQYIIDTIFSNLDLRDPGSFGVIWEKMNEFLPKNRVHHSKVLGTFFSGKNNT
jgi:hypothetical protein